MSGEDIVDLTADYFGDVVQLGQDDDVLLTGFLGYDTDLGYALTDTVSGGYGVDHAFVQSGPNGLRYDATDQTNGFAYLFGGAGIGFDADTASVNALLALLGNSAQYAFTDPSQGIGRETTTSSTAYGHVLLMNMNRNRGSLQIADDFETLSILDENGGGAGDDRIG